MIKSMSCCDTNSAFTTSNIFAEDTHTQSDTPQTRFSCPRQSAIAEGKKTSSRQYSYNHQLKRSRQMSSDKKKDVDNLFSCVDELRRNPHIMQEKKGSCISL